MKYLIDAFTRHPASVGETYPQHMKVAFSFGWQMLVSGAACIVHGVLPFCFVSKGSSTVARLYDKMVANRK